MAKYRFVAHYSYSPTRGIIRITVPKHVSRMIVDELKRRGIRTRSLIVEVEIPDNG